MTSWVLQAASAASLRWVCKPVLDRVAHPTAFRYDPAAAPQAGFPYGAPFYDDFESHLAYGGVAARRDDFDLRQILSHALRHRFLIAAFLLAGFLAGLALTLSQTAIYQATARIEISTPPARVMRDLEAVHETADIRTFQTAIEKLKSQSVVERTVQELDLARKPAFLDPQPRFSIAEVAKRLFRSDPGATEAGMSHDDRVKRAVKHVQANLAVSLIRNTSILVLSYKDADPATAAAIVNQHAQSYAAERQDQTARTTATARHFIESQVNDVKARLQQSEASLVAYAREKGITVEGGSGSLIEQNVRAINATLGVAISERLAAESLVQQIVEGRGKQLEAVLENPAALEIRSKIVELRATYQQNLRMFKADFPDMRMLRAQIGEYTGQLDDLEDAVLASMKQRHVEAISKEREIRAKLTELEADHATYADLSIKHSILKREVDSLRSQYESLVNKLNDVGVGAELKSQSITVLDQATVPASPITPRLRTILVSLVVAAGLAGLAIYLLELLNNAFRNPNQVEAHLKIPVLSALPLVPDHAVEGNLADHRSELSEAYRSLRTSLQFSGDGGTPRVLLVTSAEPGEGKTTTACKIALDFAVLGQRVLLVDADLRRPAIHRRLKLSNRNGLSNVLARKVTRKSFAQLFHVAAPNLTVITAGPIATNPVDLLSAQRMGILFDAFQRRYDLVVVDAPPVLGLSDAPILSRFADATLMVVSARQVSRRSALMALQRLRAGGAKVVGSALSRCRQEDFDGAYAYGYAGAAERQEEGLKTAAPRRILWDYYGDVHVPRPGLVGFVRSLAARMGRKVKKLRRRARLAGVGW